MGDSDVVVESLPSSQLGTKNYWDDIYQKEFTNYAENEDEGENWFGHQRMMKVINYIKKKKYDIPLVAKILDVGCGNGLFVHHMAEEGYCKLVGIDYSHQAVELATTIASDRKVTPSCKFLQVDFLDRTTWQFDERLSGNFDKFDVVHDKGTFDAVCLNPDNANEKGRLYIANLKTLLSPGSWFVITSCNWTGDELRKHFQEGFEFVCNLPAPSFQFGGKSGQTVTSNVFRRK